MLDTVLLPFVATIWTPFEHISVPFWCTQFSPALGGRVLINICVCVYIYVYIYILLYYKDMFCFFCFFCSSVTYPPPPGWPGWLLGVEK